MLQCQYTGVCGGCAWAGRGRADQHAEKLKPLRALRSEVPMIFSARDRLRDKVDLVWEAGRLGLYRQDAREILDLNGCPMMSEALEDFYLEFRQRPPPIGKGSVRLRVSPRGQRGVWLDFANRDVKTLFDEADYLRWLSTLAFVEIGQRRKALIFREDRPKLVDPILMPWFETYGSDGQAIPLFGPVGGFSQVGFGANRALVKAVTAQVIKSGVTNWVELFCGNGNLTLALASHGLNVEAVEMDPLAVQGLSQHNSPHVKITRADVYLKSKSLPDFRGRGLLVDPPRAGLREVLTLLAEGNLPSVIVYVSCFGEALLEDVRQLQGFGFVVADLVGVDQFPHTPHAEWVALLTLPTDTRYVPAK